MITCFVLEIRQFKLNRNTRYSIRATVNKFKKIGATSEAVVAIQGLTEPR